MYRKGFSFTVVTAIVLFAASTAFAHQSRGHRHFHNVKVASSVTPTVVADNPADCTTGTVQHPGLGITGASTLIYGSSKSGTGSAPGVTINVATADGITFDFSASFSGALAGEKILAVFAKGGSEGGYLYDYRPSGVLTDGGLHPPPTGNGSHFAAISHLLFCYGTPAALTPNPNPNPGNNPSSPTNPGVTVTAPSTQGTSPTTPKKTTAPSKSKVKAKKVKHRSPSRARRKAGFTG